MSYVAIIKIILLINFFSFGKVLAGERCVLSGTITGRPTTLIYIIKAGEDPRFQRIEVPVISGRFELDMVVSQPEMHMIIYEEEFRSGIMYPVMFIPHGDTIKFSLYDQQHVHLTQVSGRLNQSYYDFHKNLSRRYEAVIDSFYRRQDSLRQQRLYFSVAGQHVEDRLNESGMKMSDMELLTRQKERMQNDGSYYTKAGKEINNQIVEAENRYVEERYLHIKHNIDPVSYYLLYADLVYGNPDKNVERVQEVFPTYSRQFPSHPYTDKINDILLGVSQISIGKPLPDAPITTLNGLSTSVLTEVMKGKVTYLMLWASWCKGCIVKAREVVPVHHEYQGAGFQVISVAQEFNSLNAINNLLAKEKLPWSQFVDFNGKGGVWQRYRSTNVFGTSILIDQAGIIRQINPTAEELKRLLPQLLP